MSQGFWPNLRVNKNLLAIISRVPNQHRGHGKSNVPIVRDGRGFFVYKMVKLGRCHESSVTFFLFTLKNFSVEPKH